MAMRHWVIVLAILAIILATSQAVVPSDTFEGYVTSQGYPVESHWATTEDGYILGLFRMPSKTKNAPVVLLQHGILASAWCWVINDKNHTPAFQLWELGYDVWLSNSRGNDFSLNHTHLSELEPPDLHKFLRSPRRLRRNAVLTPPTPQM
jgi:hypothetical protein